MDDATKARLDRALVEDLFLEAVELPPSDREAFLMERCGESPAVLEEVRSLLAAHDAPGGVPEIADERPFGGRYPDRIGAYRVVRPLGEGGMGVVLLAIREGDGFEQTVALKLIRGSFVDPLLARRLEEERRILALLEHPGIARLVDGGVTAEGQPYFAMEYVRGEEVLDYCDAREMVLEDRLRLFIQVCEAIHHAHQQLVVHRDLKPSNILVTPEGRPKLLDFGIAKNLEAVSTGEQTSHWVTPAYASPEQVGGGAVSTLSDVYALGVLLCELLTGARPYETPGTSPVELARIIGEVEPRRPSELAEASLPSRDGGLGSGAAQERAARRRTTPSRLARVLRGDLDQVVLKALAKEPQRRYDSAWALGDDVRRYLERRPVRARPDSAGYRLSRFVGRNRALVAAGGLVVLALVMGSAGIFWQAQRTERERDRAEAEAHRARQVTTLMTEIFRLGDPTQALGDTIGVRQVLQEGARRVDESMGDDPVLQATLFLELARIYRNLGILGEAERLGERAVELRALHEAGSLAHAEALGFQGLLLRDAGEPEAAMDHLERAVALRESLLAEPDTALATLLAGLGWEVRSAGEYPRAAELFSSALEIQRRILGADDPAVATTMLGLAATYHDQGSFDAAEALFRGALEPDRAEASPVAATALVNLGMVQRLRERFSDAEPLLRAGLAMREQLFDPVHPDVIEARQELAVALSTLGRYGEAEPLLRQNLESAARLFGEDHEATRGAHEALGTLAQDLGRYPEALTHLELAMAGKVRTHGRDHPGIVYSLTAIGEVLVDEGHPVEAEGRFRAALEMGARLGGNSGVYGALARHGMARAALLRGDVARADSLVEVATEMALANLRENHRYVLDMRRTQALILLERGRPDEAAALLRAVLDEEARVRPHPHPRRGRTLALLGDAMAAGGDRSGAEEAWREAAAEYDGLPVGHPFRQEIRERLGVDAGGAPGDPQASASSRRRSTTLGARRSSAPVH